MNHRMILHTLGHILRITAILLLFPLIVSLIYKEGLWWSFLIPAVILAAISFLILSFKPKNTKIYAKEGFVIVGLSWILISLVGAVPYVISGSIPNYIDALFETISGFTTTGASILTNIEALPYSMLFWRSFAHWIGGMGILVFVLTIIPSTDGQNIYILRAESPGPQVGKLVSKIKLTAQILYIIYLALTVLEFLMLWLGKMDIFQAITTSFATAGTGGFSVLQSSAADFSTYCQIVIGVFMILFGVNFNLYFFILIRKFKQAFKSEELWWYLIIIFGSIAIITTNLMIASSLYQNAFGTALKDSFFQVASIITTTGFSTVDFNQWPELSKGILLLLMFIGACSGSTGGGLKVSRVAILIKALRRNLRKIIHPNAVAPVRFEDQVVDEEVVGNVSGYFATYVIIFIAILTLISIDGFDFLSNFTAVASCINNIGPGLGSIVGPAGDYSAYSGFSKIVLSLAMLIGRLEIYPVLFMIVPSTWKKR